MKKISLLFLQKKNIVIKNRLWKFIKLKNNNLILGRFSHFDKSKIEISGSNNILYCDDNVFLKDSCIRFVGNNSLVFLKRGTYTLNMLLHNNSTLYIGEYNYFNPYRKKSTIVLSEGKNIFIGNKGAFSFGLSFNTSDEHSIYDVISYKRINDAKSVYIGDHVWIGKNVTILKGVQIHSGSIIGAQSLVSNKDIASNEIWAGVPVKKIKDGVFWTSECVNDCTLDEIFEKSCYQNDDHIYKPDESTILFETIEETLNSCENVYDKYLYLKNLGDDKNRFSKC